MANVDRNAFDDGLWRLRKVEDFAMCDSFDCGDTDLNEYFQKDSEHYRANLLTQTYCLVLQSVPDFAIALLDFCNDAVILKDIGIELQTDRKSYTRSFPAVKLTRLGVRKEFRRRHIGSNALNMIKRFFTMDNRTGCRLITVDAYDNPDVLSFYEKNDFQPLLPKDEREKTRALYFDLKRFENT